MYIFYLKFVILLML